ncbi:MAG: TolC family protein [Cyclobacteriaceae bacterium]|nr:TolC family protein [Cyclobacteriaceae bacterium]
MYQRYLMLFCLVFLVYYATAQSNDDQINISILIDYDQAEAHEFAELIQYEIDQLFGNSYELKYDKIIFSNLVNDSSEAAVLIQQILQDESVDIVIGAGVLISGTLHLHAPFEKLVIATSVIDPNLQGIPYKEGTSGLDNFTYVILPTDFYRDLEVFHDIYPYQHLIILVDDYIYRSVGDSDKRGAAYMEQVKAQYQVIPVRKSADQVISQMDSLADAVYFGPLISLDESGIDKLINTVNARNLPSFSIYGRQFVERGILGGLAPASNSDRIARRTALNLERYLDGKKLANLPVHLNYQEELTVNMATARTIGFSPGWDVLREAVLLNEEETDITRTLNLQTAIEEALATNWTLAIANKQVEAGQKDVVENRASLLPQLDISATTSIIDKDRAAAASGLNPQRLTQGSSNLTQVIYSEGALANYQVAKRLQDARVQQRATTQLDVILETAEAYLNVLITKTVERIQKDNIRLNRINLQLAEVRQEVGFEGPSDLYRWQSNIALANIELNNAQANRRTAEINLNRILNRPMDEGYNTIETDILDPNLITNDPRLDGYVNNPEDLRKFTAFMVNEGLNLLPEIKQIDANLQAQERLIKLYRRNLYLPEIGVSGGANYTLNRGGAGSEQPSLGPGVEVPNDLTWQLGLSASLPLFTGGRRSATYQRGIIELEQLRFEKYQLINQLEQQIRSSMQQVGASYANIQLSNEAKTASSLNFDLVQEAYKQGTVSVINLIDAQNQAIQAQLNAANAGYQFIIDILNVDRAIGKFYSLSTEDERESYFIRLKEFTENFDK